jgi:hypothetical protein
MSDQLVAEAATYTTRISMSSPGIEPAIPAIKELETYALHRIVIYVS